MSGINTPFPVDSEVLGLIGSMFGPFRQNCFAQGIVKKDGTLDPSVTSLVVKVDSLSGDALGVFGLQGRISASSGVMSSKNSPATALAATFTSDGHVSSAVFGTIEPITHTHLRIHALAGIHASFGHVRARGWKCTKVIIGDTFWTPWMGCTNVTNVIDYLNHEKEEPFFCHDFTTDETYVQIEKSTTIPGYVYRMILRPDGMIAERNISGTGRPSDGAVARAETMLREYNTLLQSKMDAIKWLEVSHVERHKQRDKQVNAVFSWMHEFHKRQIQIPILTQRSSIFKAHSLIPDILAAGHSRSPAMSRFLLERAIHDPVNLYDPSNPMSRFIQPCKCTPMHNDPACKSDSCIFKNSSLLLTQEKYRQPIISRFSELERKLEKETSKMEKKRESAMSAIAQRMRDKMANEKANEKSKKEGSKKEGSKKEGSKKEGSKKEGSKKGGSKKYKKTCKRR